MEEIVDVQKEEVFEREGNIKNFISVYDVEVFIVIKKVILGVLVVVDILFLIY